MPSLIDSLAGTPRFVWLDELDYTVRLLANGQAPLLAIDEFVAFRRKAAGLLKPGLALLPVADVVAAWLDTQPALVAAMAAKKRAVFPLRTLLADEALREHLVELASALRGAFRDVPLVLALPSPRTWVNLVFERVHGAATEVGTDEVDAAAMYMAEFLRAFGEIGIDALLLRETPEQASVDAGAIALYQPVLNVAAHYRWTIGLQLTGLPALPTAVPGIDFMLADAPVAGVTTGVAVDVAVWEGSAANDNAGQFLFLHIPRDAVPERVLEVLAALRR
jgi:hypothetical protein